LKTVSRRLAVVARVCVAAGEVGVEVASPAAGSAPVGGQPLAEQHEIAPVGVERVARQALLQPEGIDEGARAVLAARERRRVHQSRVSFCW
jgi:hypothetical protein